MRPKVIFTPTTALEASINLFKLMLSDKSVYKGDISEKFELPKAMHNCPLCEYSLQQNKHISDTVVTCKSCPVGKDWLPKDSIMLKCTDKYWCECEGSPYESFMQEYQTFGVYTEEAGKGLKKCIKLLEDKYTEISKV